MSCWHWETANKWILTNLQPMQHATRMFEMISQLTMCSNSKSQIIGNSHKNLKHLQSYSLPNHLSWINNPSKRPIQPRAHRSPQLVPFPQPSVRSYPPVFEVDRRNLESSQLSPEIRSSPMWPSNPKFPGGGRPVDISPFSWIPPISSIVSSWSDEVISQNPC